MMVFLDFDGVLHPEPCADDELFCHLSSIEEVLREYPHVLVVISSAWRLAYRHRAISRLRKYFSQDIARRIVGVTPDYRRADETLAPKGLGLLRRQWECIGWLRAHRPPGTPGLRSMTGTICFSRAVKTSSCAILQLVLPQRMQASCGRGLAKHFCAIKSSGWSRRPAAWKVLTRMPGLKAGWKSPKAGQ